MADHPNKDICDILLKVGKHEQEVSGLVYKFVAYNKAAKALAGLDTRVKSGAEAKKLPGIGPKISSVIDTILAKRFDELPISVDGSTPADDNNNDSPRKEKAGKTPSKEAKEKKSRKKKKIEEDSSSSSSEDEPEPLRIADHYSQLLMTPIDVANLRVVHGIETFEQLKKHPELLEEDAQRDCLKHYEDLCKPVTLEEGEKFLTTIQRAFDESDPNSFFLSGDFRRRLSESSTVDILISDAKLDSTDRGYEKTVKKKMKQFFEGLNDANIQIEQLKTTKERYICLAKLKKSKTFRMLRFDWAAHDEFVCRMFSLTGSKAFVDDVKEKAMNKDYELDDRSLRKYGVTLVPGELIPLKSEHDLFDHLQLNYVPPEKRL